MKRTFPLFALLVVLGLPLRPALAAAPEQVTLANTSTGVQLLLPYIAAQKGFFLKHGLDVTVTLVKGDAGSIPALVSGSVQFAIMTATPALIADSKGGHMRIITPLSTYPQQIVMRKAFADKLGITAATPLAIKLHALIGRQVGILDVGGGLQYQLEALLSSNGINPNQVPVVGITPYSAELAALKRGAIDVIGPSVPFGQTAVAEGFGVMIANIWGGEVPNLRGTPFELMSVTDAWGKAHPAAVEAMRAAIQDAMHFPPRDTAAAAALAFKRQPKIPLAIQTAAIGDGAGYPTTNTITEAQFAAMQDFAKLSGAKTASVMYAQAVWGK
jgi:ABC-type nitrate/sulfonate/bicarbonate transport system substrate-binding protein